MPKYKLTYFDMRARAETIRMLFQLSATPFEDNRISREDWNKLKPTTRGQPLYLALQWGMLPVLEMDGKQMTQTFAIVRFLARQWGYAGKTDWEAYQCDEIGGILDDLYSSMRPWYMEQDPERKQKLRDEIDERTKKLLAIMDERIKNSSSGYFVGDNLTWVDLEMSERVLFYRDEKPDLIKGCDNLIKFLDKIHSLPKLKDYINSRKK